MNTIRFLFFIGLIFVVTLLFKVQLKADCDLESGQFIGCGENLGDNSNIHEIGTPQTLVDKDDPNSGLTPIEQTDYNNPNNISFLGKSNVKFYFYNFLNNATITVADASRLDLQLYNSNADISFILDDNNGLSSISYRGGTTGKVSVYLNKLCNNSDCFRTSGNIDYLNFQGEITNNPDGTVNSIENGGTFTVGTEDNEGTEQAANIVVNNITGNGSIELTPNSKLVIKNYNYNDSNDSYGIQRIRGGAGSEVTFDTKIFIRALEASNAIFNYYSKIKTISSDSYGKYTFNASSDIGNIEIMHNMAINNGAHINVNSLSTMDEVNIAKDSVLQLAIQNTTTTDNGNNVINKIQGEGTLWINPSDWVVGENTPYKITDINLGNLIFDNGEMLIQNSGSDYTNSETDEHGEVTSSVKVIRHIKNITKSNGAVGGEITVKGTVIFDNIDYLNKLIICDTFNVEACAKNTNLTIKKVHHLNSLEMNGGSLYLDINNSNNIRNNNFTAALNINDITINPSEKGTHLIGIIQDTTSVKNKNTYLVISSPNKINGITGDILSSDVFKTSLPDWYSYGYRLEQNDTKLMLDVERLASYHHIVESSSLKDDTDILNLSSYFDSLINNNTPLDMGAKTITYLDLLSQNNYDVLANNIKSLIPLSKNNYIETSHFNLKEALNISKSKGIANKEPFSMWDKRYQIQPPKDNIWFVSYFSNGKYDNSHYINQDSHNSKAVQFGYSFYNWVSDNNKEGETFNIMGGLSKGKMSNYSYNTDISSFNLGGIFDFRDENDIIKFSLLYNLTSFDTQRDYFVSNYQGTDYQELSKERLQSKPNTHEFLLDMQYSHETFLEYLSTFGGWKNVVFTPKLYLTPSLLIGTEYEENGEISSIKVGNYITPILESGTGFNLSKEFNFTTNQSMKFYFSTDLAYRYYKIPSNKIGFSESSSLTSVSNDGSWNGFIVTPEVGINFNYRSSEIIGFYKREISKDYYQNIVGVSYKYLF